MTLQLNRKLFTVEEYHKLIEVGILTEDDRVELINGEIIAMSPINSNHAGIVNRLSRILLKKLDLKATITIQNPILLTDSSEPEPDLTIAHFSENDYISKHPGPSDIYLVLEVSDSTLVYDQSIKATLYATANIPEYWIINLLDRQIEIHRQPKNDEYHFKQIISEEGIIQASSIDFSLNYSEVFK